MAKIKVERAASDIQKELGKIMLFEAKDKDFKNVVITGDVDITGDVIAKTFTQSQANWKGGNINFVAPTGLTITNTYNRLEIINQVLYCIVNFKLENNSGESKTFNAVDLITSIPNVYAQQIFDVNGDSVAEAIASDYIFITCEPATAMKNDDTYSGQKLSGKILLANRNSANNLSVFAQLDENLTMADGDYIFFTGRIALTLL